MSWSIGWDSNWYRDIGYGVPAWCDHPDCNEEIDRGLSHVCGNAPYGGDEGCGLYFCGTHQMGDYQRCDRCVEGAEPFDAKPDHSTWIAHKQTDPSWQAWRDEQAATS